MFYHEKHYDSFNTPSWKYFFNYGTKYPGVDDIVDLTYISAEKLGEAKFSRKVTDLIDKEIEGNGTGRNSLIKLGDKILGLEKPLLATNENMSWTGKGIKGKFISLILRAGMRIFH